MSRIVVALGGNALGKNLKEQKELVKITAKIITKLAKERHQIAIVHGNGPQVGMIFNAFTLANKHNKNILPMPFPESGALSQAYIGYHLQQAIKNEFIKQNTNRSISTIVTQSIVEKDDPRFAAPSKPIGSFFDEKTAKELAKQNNWIVKEDAGRGWRRVVPSPLPVGFVEINVIRTLFNNGDIIICAGGGGVPVYYDNDNSVVGIAAVIDKDFAAAKLAELIRADNLIILTAVPTVMINYGKANQKGLKEVTVKQLEEYIKQNQFSPGSMLPKINAVLSFVKNTKQPAYIGALKDGLEITKGKKGTKIVL